MATKEKTDLDSLIRQASKKDTVVKVDSFMFRLRKSGNFGNDGSYPVEYNFCIGHIKENVQKLLGAKLNAKRSIKQWGEFISGNQNKLMDGVMDKLMDMLGNTFLTPDPKTSEMRLVPDPEFNSLWHVEFTVHTEPHTCISIDRNNLIYLTPANELGSIKYNPADFVFEGFVNGKLSEIKPTSKKETPKNTKASKSGSPKKKPVKKTQSKKAKPASSGKKATAKKATK